MVRTIAKIPSVTKIEQYICSTILVMIMYFWGVNAKGRFVVKVTDYKA